MCCLQNLILFFRRVCNRPKILWVFHIAKPFHHLKWPKVLHLQNKCRLYKERWNVELFFKWIKQNLRIKKFYGNNENAVKVQIWIAVCDYLIIAILKKELNLKPSMNQILQILSISLFEKTAIKKLFEKDDTIIISNQQSLF